MNNQYTTDLMRQKKIIDFYLAKRVEEKKMPDEDIIYTPYGCYFETEFQWIQKQYPNAFYMIESKSSTYDFNLVSNIDENKRIVFNGNAYKFKKDRDDAIKKLMSKFRVRSTELSDTDILRTMANKEISSLQVRRTYSQIVEYCKKYPEFHDIINKNT